MSTNSISYIEAQEVVDNIRASASASTEESSFVIIDVREEYEVKFDGQIKGPVLHLPSPLFSSIASAKDIIREYDLLSKGTIAVHCHKSQQRGPYCARLLSDAVSEIAAADRTLTSIPDIRVLRYGYEGFMQRYTRSGESNELIHNPIK